MRIVELFNKINNKVLDLFFVFSFLFILFIGFISIFRSNSSLIYIENRYASKPIMPNIRNFYNGTFQDNIEKSLTDKFYFSQTIKIYMAKNLNLIKYDNIPYFICNGRNVFIDKGNVLYNCSRQIHAYSNGNLTYDKKLLNVFSLMNDYSDVYYYTINDGISYNFEENIVYLDTYDYLKKNLKNKYNISKLEINSFNDYDKYFYDTDHHWNHNGSYQGYLDILKLLNIEDESRERIIKKINNYEFYGTRSKEAYNLNMGETFYYNEYVLNKHDIYINSKNGEYSHKKPIIKSNYTNFYPELLGYDFGEIYIDYNDDSKDNLLIIGTSFTNPINEVIASHFNKTYIVDGRHFRNYDGSIVNLKKYIDSHEIDKVLVIYDSEFSQLTDYLFVWED